MKMKKLILGICALALVATLGVTAFAAETTQSNWDALTEEQKEEIYGLKDQSYSVQVQIIEKYLEWGLIDEATATDMKTSLEERQTSMRENNKAPLLGRRGGRGMRGNCRNCPVAE